jgi:hypothetical protein
MAAQSTDLVLVERAGVLVKVPAADLVAAVLLAQPNTLPAPSAELWLDDGVLAHS